LGVLFAKNQDSSNFNYFFFNLKTNLIFSLKKKKKKKEKLMLPLSWEEMICLKT
jgi:hypothetical protein